MASSAVVMLPAPVAVPVVHPPRSSPAPVSILATLETIDGPQQNTLRDIDIPALDLSSRNPASCSTSSPSTETERLPVRISRLPPVPTIPSNAHNSQAGPSAPQRYFFIGIRCGHTRGVYSDWTKAECQVNVSPISFLSFQFVHPLHTD